MQPEREQVRLKSLLQIVFRFCLICICKVFDEMAARIQVLNFEKIFGGCARLVLVSLQMLGFWKLSLFEWFLKKWDLPTWYGFNFALSLNYAFESFWMITKWALILCYEYIQGVQRSRKVSVRFWKFKTTKVDMGVKLFKMTIHSFSFVLIYLSLGKVWEMFRWCLFHLRNILQARKHTNKVVQKNFKFNAYSYACFQNFI